MMVLHSKQRALLTLICGRLIDVVLHFLVVWVIKRTQAVGVGFKKVTLLPPTFADVKAMLAVWGEYFKRLKLPTLVLQFHHSHVLSNVLDFITMP